MTSSTSRLIRLVGLASVCAFGFAAGPPFAAAAEIVRPSADGTLTDGGVYGVFDGLADNWDWTFNQSSYEGSVSLAITPEVPSLEQRVVWEFNLGAVTLQAPVSATLHITLRGAALYPMPDSVIQAFAYPADLVENPSDYSAGPAILQGSVIVPAFQAPTALSVDVSNAVSAALSGNRKVAFRFQPAPGGGSSVAQAFFDASDTDITTKPYLSIDAGSAGVPAALVTTAVSRKANAGAPGGICDLPLIPARKAEPRTSGITEVRIGFDLAPGAPSGTGMTLEQASCTAPTFVPYSGPSTASSLVTGNELIVSFNPALENGRTYRMTLSPSVTSVSGQSVEVRALIGDVDSSGQVNAGDRSAVVGVWTGTGFSCITDVNGTGRTDAGDRSAIVGAWTGTQNCAP